MNAEDLGVCRIGKYSLVSLENSTVFQSFSNISYQCPYCCIFVFGAVGTAMESEKLWNQHLVR